jgi:hypothetical protein
MTTAICQARRASRVKEIAAPAAFARVSQSGWSLNDGTASADG